MSALLLAALIVLPSGPKSETSGPAPQLALGLKLW